MGCRVFGAVTTADRLVAILSSRPEFLQSSELLKSFPSRLSPAARSLVWSPQHTICSLGVPGLIYCHTPNQLAACPPFSSAQSHLLCQSHHSTCWMEVSQGCPEHSESSPHPAPPTIPPGAPATLASPMLSAARHSPSQGPAWVRVPASKFPVTCLASLLFDSVSPTKL